MGEGFPLDELLPSRRGVTAATEAELEDLIVLVDFVGGPFDGAAAWVPPCCPGCGRSIDGHPFAMRGTVYIAEATRRRRRFVARPARELPA